MDVDLPLIDGLRMNKKRREAESGELGPAGEDTMPRVPIGSRYPPALYGFKHATTRATLDADQTVTTGWLWLWLLRPLCQIRRLS
jgi:hypothetical protein